MSKGYKNKAYFLTLLLASGSTAFAGTMGDVSDDSKHYFFSVTALYGELSDESLNKFNYADTSVINGTNAGVVSNLTSVDPRWGYALSLGYKFGPEKSDDVVLSYMNLKNHSSNGVAVSGVNDRLANNMSLIVSNNGSGLYQGPAAAQMDTYYEFQSAELITHHNFRSETIKPIRFSRFMGLKATQFKKGFTTGYRGTDVVFFGPNTDYNDVIDYDAKYEGIGPQIGGGAYWDFNSFISIGGDMSFSILGGQHKSRINEVLHASNVVNMEGLSPQADAFNYSQAYNSALWVVPVLGANISVAAKYDLNSGGSLGLEAGTGTEQYWSESATERYKRKLGINTLSLSQRFSMRNVFLKATYVC